MPRTKQKLKDFIGAILDRDSGMSYPEVLEQYDIKPNQFYRAVKFDLEDLIRETAGSGKKTLTEIAKDYGRRLELFDMGEEFVRRQYDNVQNGRQKRFYEGTFTHHENIEALVYYALICHNHQLASTQREELIQGLKNLPANLQNYFNSIGLGGLMTRVFERGKIGSPLAVLEVFDRVYQKRTEDISLFNLNHPQHLHKGGRDFRTPQSYWKNPANVEEAIYHTLIEYNPQLASTRREEVIQGIKNLPTNLKEYFCSIGLGGLMVAAFGKGKQGSPLAVLEVFDRVYQKKTDNVSLFDLSQKEHLHMWGDNFMAPQSYWKNSDNVEEAVYHTLTENNQKLSSENRKEVIETIKNLPVNLQKYFASIGLGGLMAIAFGKGKNGSPLAVLEVFDQVYQRKTRDASLFDKTRKYHLEFDKINRLIR